jgi:hypothetical protein
VRFLLITVLVLTVAAPSVSQAACDRTVADLPEIHGLRLGTSRREVERTYTFTPTSIKYKRPNKRNVEHLEGIWIDFYQESLAAVEFDYDRNTKWKNVREFAAFLESSLELPMDSWVFIDRTEAVMKCTGFTVAISSVRNTLSLSDTFANAASQQNLARIGRSRERVVGQ